MKTTFTPFPADNAWTRPLVHARDRYFGVTPAVLDEARAYLAIRKQKDAASLLQAMEFKLIGLDVMKCTIYQHVILLNTRDGSGTFTSFGDTYTFVNMVQVLAYILAVNW